MGDYDIRYEFPVRMMTDSVLKALQDETPQDISGDELVDMDIAKSALAQWGQDPSNPDICTATIEFYETRGSNDVLEKALKDSKIPFDRWCSAADGNNPDILYYRPGNPDIERTVQLTIDAVEYVPVDVLKLLLSSKDPISAIEEYLADNFSDGLMLIEDYCTETELGRDKEKMTRIDAVLARLDAGEIDNKTAMAEIAAIQEEENVHG